MGLLQVQVDYKIGRRQYNDTLAARFHHETQHPPLETSSFCVLQRALVKVVYTVSTRKPLSPRATREEKGDF